MKEHKTQLLAALALAFSLGMVMPSLTFASEGTDETEISAQAEGSIGGGVNDGEVISQNVAENIVELLSRIATRESFAGYRKAEDYVYAAGAVAEYTENAKEFLGKQVSGFNDKNYWANLSEETREAVKDKTVYDALVAIKDANGADYTTLKTRTDLLLTDAADNMALLKREMTSLMPTVSTSGLTTPTALLAEAAKLPSYEKYVNLFSALTFVRATATSNQLTCAGPQEQSADGNSLMGYCAEIAERLETALDKDIDNTDLFKDYNELAKAAVAIDETVMEGLMDWKLPDTSAGTDVNAPNTGIIGLIESGALDLGMVTLIVSVALASVAGLGLIAKLYLKHKF